VLFSFCGAATHYSSKRVRFRASKRKAAGGRFSRRETWSVTDFWSKAVLGEKKPMCSMSQQLQKIHRNRDGFFHLCPQDTTSFACSARNIIWALAQHHFAARRTQMNEVALRANDVLRNDVGLRPMKLRFAQTNCI